MIKNIRHFGIVTRDINKSLQFYQKYLGFTLSKKTEEKGDYISKVLGISGADIITVKLSVKGGDVLIELIQFIHPHDRSENRVKINGIGPTHIAFTVDDIKSLYYELSGSNVEFISEPELSSNGDAIVAFCRDPDGTFIEFVELI
ncbi:VOC family protein [Methanoplanus limicola]|uniref:Glyoxalase/bleomycin resistance protein/dioxygenase n=1 Tax=Methanoplanus limicola DSM 2279 TaxID=937775 RepID=H1YXB2_9EURY|nr:VOC family protein [Methanoplanus limicola]EHQ36849.1 Glyoxalase/bleomycin resistance protein/dioxygenase [Methanoplanus limicola DSM 2279]